MTDDDSPWGARGISVTIKFGKGYEEPWVVFRGTAGQIKTDMLDAFGLDAGEYAAFSLSELIINVRNSAQATGTLRKELGGQVIRPGSGAKPVAPAPGQDVWADAGSAPPAQAPSVEDILGKEIDAAAGRTALKTLYGENKATFDASEVLMAAYKAKGKSLPAGS
ncbi:hypothetical protein AB0J80_36155 [Actinoplanes sp. NPDC049548]|uniref:hypothetical protein n=1 Tax=Actinoplanes sp. NPDC049548 TaxID=3155152 RepID=UPI0034140DFB